MYVNESKFVLSTSTVFKSSCFSTQAVQRLMDSLVEVGRNGSQQLFLQRSMRKRGEKKKKKQEKKKKKDCKEMTAKIC